MFGLGINLDKLQKRIRSRVIATAATLLTVLGVAAALAAAPQIDELGLPLELELHQSVYRSHVQNWSFVEDAFGVLWIGNNHGALTWDGVRWELAPTPSGGILRPIAADHRGGLWWGAQGDFGRIERDEVGRPRLVSLRHLLPADAPLFTDVWSIHELGDEIWFATAQALIALAPDGTFRRVIRPAGILGPASPVDGELWLGERNGRGLVRLAGDELVAVAGGEAFASDPVAFVVPLSGGDRLVGTISRGLFRLGDRTAQPVAGEAAQLLAADRPLSTVLIADGTRVVGTIAGALWHLDDDGTPRLRWPTGASAIAAVATDADGGLWVADHGFGLRRLRWPGGVSIFDRRQSLPGGPEAIARHNGRLLVAGDNGVAALTPASDGEPARFEPFSDLGDAWSLLSTEWGLLAATQGGLYVLDDAGTATRLYGGAFRCLVRDGGDGAILAGGDGRVLRLSPTGDGWSIEIVLAEPGFTAHNIVAGDDRLWCGSHHDGIRVIDADGHVSAIGREQGLPAATDPYAYVFRVDGAVVIGTARGLYEPHPAAGGWRLEPSDRLGQKLRGGGDLSVYLVDQVSREHIVVRSNTDGLVEGPPGDRRFRTDVFVGVRSSATHDLHVDPDGIVWLAKPAAVLRLDPEVGPVTREQFAAAVVAVDALGAGRDRLWTRMLGLEPRLDVAASGGAVRLKLAAPSFGDGGRTEFSTRIGETDAWSPFVAEPYRDLTNLPAGETRFEVRARTLDGGVSRAGAFTIVAPLPWYRTLPGALALLVGAVVAAFVVAAGGAAVQRRKAAVREAELQRIVDERTHELRERTERIESYERTRSRFFANITHELRTPLALIMSGAQELVSGRAGSQTDPARREATMIQRAAAALLETVEELLDIARLEAGALALERAPVDLSLLVRETIAAHSSWAEREEVGLVADLPERPVAIDADARRFKRVISNLLSNAITHSRRGQTITIRVRADDGRAVLTVDDEGPGIPDAILPHVFERFIRSRRDGVGLGLALVRDLVELHDGEVRAENLSDGGARFVVELPLTDATPIKSEATASVADAVPTPVTTTTVEAADQGSESDLPLVLVVEDHPEMRRVISRDLEPAFRVVVAADGEEGLRVATELVPDAVVADVMMPGRTGIELVAALRADPATDFVPILLLTGLSASDDMVAGLDAGADDYLVKPAQPEELVARVRALIASRRRMEHRLAVPPGTTVLVSAPQIDTADDDLLARLRAVLDERLDDPSFRVEDLAAELAMERSTLHKRLKALTGEAPGELLRRARLERAEALLAGGAGNVSEVAYAVGFASVSSFSTSFKRHFGRSPSEVVRSSKMAV